MNGCLLDTSFSIKVLLTSLEIKKARHLVTHQIYKNVKYMYSKFSTTPGAE